LELLHGAIIAQHGVCKILRDTHNTESGLLIILRQELAKGPDFWISRPTNVALVSEPCIGVDQNCSHSWQFLRKEQQLFDRPKPGDNKKPSAAPGNYLNDTPRDGVHPYLLQKGKRMLGAGQFNALV
jgi:hypothetical protein